MVSVTVHVEVKDGCPCNLKSRDCRKKQHPTWAMIALVLSTLGEELQVLYLSALRTGMLDVEEATWISAPFVFGWKT